MINLFVQGRTKSLRHHTVQARLKKRQFVLAICRARTTMRLLWLLLSLCVRENRERRNVTCGVKTGYEKETYSHISLLSELKIYARDWHNYVPPCVKLRKRTSVVLVMSLVLVGANDIFAMSSDLKKINRDLLEDFIRAYESQSCLRRIKSKDYHDKAKRDAAYDILLKKYRLINPNADKEAVLRRLMPSGLII
jgi:hypothetical protein